MEDFELPWHGELPPNRRRDLLPETHDTWEESEAMDAMNHLQHEDQRTAAEVMRAPRRSELDRLRLIATRMARMDDDLSSCTEDREMEREFNDFSPTISSGPRSAQSTLTSSGPRSGQSTLTNAPPGTRDYSHHQAAPAPEPVDEPPRSIYCDASASWLVGGRAPLQALPDGPAFLHGIIMRNSSRDGSFGLLNSYGVVQDENTWSETFPTAAAGHRMTPEMLMTAKKFNHFLFINGVRSEAGMQFARHDIALRWYLALPGRPRLYFGAWRNGTWHFNEFVELLLLRNINDMLRERAALEPV